MNPKNHKSVESEIINKVGVQKNKQKNVVQEEKGI